jgi:regulator of Ty1 transposition protein 103
MDFIEAFSPIMAEGIAVAYKGAPSEVQGKIKRVVDVWRDRKVFEDAIQDAIDARTAELDRMRAAPSSFSPFTAPAPSMPDELASLVSSHQAVTKNQTAAKTAASSANQDYLRITDPSTRAPAPPVYAARLNGLLKVLAGAETAVSASAQARRELMGQLRKLLHEHEEALTNEEKQLSELSTRRCEVEGKKDEVERSIILGISADGHRSPVDGPSGSPAPEPDRPEVEALTPPDITEEPELPENPASTYPPIDVPQGQGAAASGAHSVAPGIEMLSNLASQYQSLPVTANGANKRRRLDGEDGCPDLGEDGGIDADVTEILRKEKATQGFEG